MRPEPPRSGPTATYRLQLTGDQGFRGLADLAPHLARLGVSHAYLSPVLKSAPGSRHGYDVIDHSQVDDELGGLSGLRSAAVRLREHGVQILLDVVPNHMSLVTPEYLNGVLWEALRDGGSSRFANWFDVEWDRERPMLMPILGRRIDECLDDDEIVLDPTGGPDGEAVLRYFDHVLPVRPGTEELPLLELLARQHYRLAYWRIADEELNYRRFFDVDTLLAIRVEDPEVFEATHVVPLALMAEGVVGGLRIDHPDGLYDPAAYLDRVADATDEAWVVVEKILLGDEELPRQWRCDGTTGYDGLHRIGSLFVDPAGEPVLRGGFAEFSGVEDDWPETVERSRRDVLRGLLVSEVDRLAEVAGAICADEVRLRDHSRRGLTDAVYELLVAIPVYRAYVAPDTPADSRAIDVLDRAARRATARRPDRAAEIALVREMALGGLGRSARKDEFCLRFQQTSGPAIAKGVEDTAAYRWFPLASLCEVGGEPDRFGIDPVSFHTWADERRERWPYSLTALSTHDTKRSEDVRARLSVLSEIAGEWVTTVRAWRDVVGRLGVGRDDGERDERLAWLGWQTVVGAWPIDAERLTAYLVKAAREAKLQTSWTDPDPAHEAAIADFVARIFADAQVTGSIQQMVERLHPGFVANVLGQRAVQLFLPGVPDIYQGCEVVALSLVDPDNRRPVDREWVEAALARGCAALVDPYADLDAAKAALTAAGLRLRRTRPGLVDHTAVHRGLDCAGEGADHVVGFRRGEDVAVLATRFALRLAAAGGWRDTTVRLPSGRWRDVATGAACPGGVVTLADVLGAWPVAVLERVDD